MHEKSNTTAKTESTEPPAVSSEELRRILASNVVYPTREGFIVSSPNGNGSSVDYRVKRNLRQDLVCCCETFLDEVLSNQKFKCDHLYAVEAYLFSKLQAIKNKPDTEYPVRFRCHHLTATEIKDLIQKISEHSEGKPLEEIRQAIQKELGNKKAPEGCLQEGAENALKFLKEWWANLNTVEVDQAA